MDSTNDSQNKRKSVKSKLEQNGLMQARINNYMDNRHHARYGRSTIHRNIVVGDTSKDQQQNIIVLIVLIMMTAKIILRHN